MAKAHKIELSPDVIARVTKRRGGKLHAFDRLDPAKTALIVIDMQNVWVKEGMPAYTPYCEAIVPNINLLARAMRDAGGSVWWIRAIYGDDAPTHLVGVHGIPVAGISRRHAGSADGR
ncbi:MAG TPA: isochorismatase family protein [Xanthobacteraceae bacterium]|jgi:ureidoacrylate peracid hydrolase|nr:isochorismatase family protein [Xanthobacteraceae bacterium]